jgi:hypothetical protein
MRPMQRKGRSIDKDWRNTRVSIRPGRIVRV